MEQVIISLKLIFSVMETLEAYYPVKMVPLALLAQQGVLTM